MIRKVLKTASIISAAACLFAAVGIVGAISDGAGLELSGGSVGFTALFGIFSGLAYLLG